MKIDWKMMQKARHLFIWLIIYFLNIIIEKQQLFWKFKYLFDCWLLKFVDWKRILFFSFDCPDLIGRDTSKCYFKNETLNPGEILDSLNHADTCEAKCYCNLNRAGYYLFIQKCSLSIQIILSFLSSRWSIRNLLFASEVHWKVAQTSTG